MDVLSLDEINKAVKAIMSAERLDIYGIGASAIVAQDAMHKFMRINKACTAYLDNHMQLASAANLTSKDVAMGISYSGQTIDTIEALRLAKEAKPPLFALLNSGTPHYRVFRY